MSDNQTTTKQRRAAGAFDIRNFIGALIGLYGAVLVIVSFFDTAEEIEKSGIRINLWAGLGMLAVAAFFITWARLRPVVVPEEPEAPEDQNTPPAH